MSHSVKKPRAFWFQCLVNRNGVAIMRQGTIPADYAHQAMGELRKMAEEWGHPLMEAGIYELTDDGEVGRQILKSEGGGPALYHSPNRPEVKPYEFGTWYSKKTFKVLNIGDT